MGGTSPSASCKLLRHSCAKDCIFAPYFPSDVAQKFAIIHKVFGASNVDKMLQELTVHQRVDIVISLVYEANARVRDPVYDYVRAISYLQNQVLGLQMQLAVSQAEILCIQMQRETDVEPVVEMQNPQLDHHHDPGYRRKREKKGRVERDERGKLFGQMNAKVTDVSTR